MPYLLPRLLAAKDATQWPTVAAVQPAGSLLAQRLSAIAMWAGACIEVLAAYYAEAPTETWEVAQAAAGRMHLSGRPACRAGPWSVFKSFQYFR